METIKECPFCGCEDVTVSASYIRTYTSWAGIVVCEHCQASGSICSGGESEEEVRQAAIKNWNTACRPNWC